MRALQTFEKWFDAVDFGAPEKNRLARYLQGIFLSIIFSMVVLIVNYALVGEWLIVGLMIGICLWHTLLLIALRRGHLEITRILFVAGMLVLLSIGLFLKNGVRGAGAFMYPVIIIFASILLKRRDFTVFTLLTLTSAGLLIVAEERNALYIQKFDPPGVPLFITYSMMLIFTAIIVRIVTESWQDSLARSEKVQSELGWQKALLEISEARWRALIVHAPVLIATVDRAGAIKYTNMSDFASLGPRTIFDFMNEADHVRARRGLERCFATGKAGHYEVELKGVALQPGFYNIGIGPVIEDGEVIEAVIIATDINRQKQAEAEIRTLNAELDQRVRASAKEADTAYRELEMFSYAVSHNLRTPVRGMTGFSEMLLRDHGGQLDSTARNFLRKISSNAVTMGLMIDDLLEFLQLGRGTLKLREVSPTQLAQSALESLPSYRDAHEIAFTIDTMPRVQADPELLTRVYSNLLDNAIKFTRGRRGAAIHVGMTETDKGPAFFVKDNGIGFDMRYVDKLFGVFQQLHRPGEYEGTGVGLATVQRIVRRHGGHVWVEAELNKGATFYFTL